MRFALQFDVKTRCTLPSFITMRGGVSLGPGDGISFTASSGLVTFTTAISLMTLDMPESGKKNIFSGRILEIEGLPGRKVEQAFELLSTHHPQLGGRRFFIAASAPLPGRALP